MEEKIRLAVFGQKRLSREGGIEIVVKELCTRMAQNGCDVTCYNRAGHHVSGAEYDKTIEYDGIRQKVVPTIEKKGLAAVSSSFFAALYSAFGRYDVVHIHAEGPAFFCWIPKLFGKRVISTIHGLDWAREKWKFGVGSKFIRQGEKNAVKYADEIIVLSKGVQKYFMETYGRETHFIPNGVNRPQIRKASLITDKFGLKKDSYILFLGRLVPEKGIRYLVEAFKNVKTDKKLVIAGGSSDTDSFMEELKELAKGDERILFTGFVQGAMLDELYSNAYIYTLPSDLEGMPLSLLEAMSYGNCCLVSDIPECAEVVEDKALIFKKSDVEDLREKLQDACDHPEMVIRMKNQAADFICEKYNWDESEVAEEVQDTFERYRKTQDYKTSILSTATVLGLSKASVTSYLPYKKGVYFQSTEKEKISVGAERQRRYRAVRKLRTEPTEEHLWEVVLLYAGVRLKTYSGLPFTYEIRKGRNGQYTKELWIDRRENSKSLAWSSVLLALGNIKKVGEVVERPKALGDIRGVTYIYGMFYRFGLINVPDEAKEKMKKAFGKSF